MAFINYISNGEFNAEVDHITKPNGVVTAFKLGTPFVKIARKSILNLKVPKKKPETPLCFTSYNHFKNVNNGLPHKLFELKKDFLSGQSTTHETKNKIKNDPVLTEYFEKRKLPKEKDIYKKINTNLENTIIVNGTPHKQVALPPLMDHLRTQYFPEKSISELNYIQKNLSHNAEDLCKKNNLENRTKEGNNCFTL